MRAAAELAGVPETHVENVQVVRYYPGGFYKHHQDSCCRPGTPDCHKMTHVNGDRIAALLMYLVEPEVDFTGGHTDFPGFDLQIRAPAGAGIFWRTVVYLNDTLLCHPYGVHAGLPVDKGVKYVGNGME